MTADEAQRHWDQLSKKEGDGDPRSWGEQFVELGRVLRSGTVDEQVAKLHALYRSKPLDDSQQRMIAKYEDVLLPQLGRALGKAAKSMKGTLHRGQPVFGAVEPQVVPPTLPAYAEPKRPEEPPLSLREGMTLAEMLAELRAQLPDSRRAATLEMLSEWAGRPWNSVVELGRPALEVIWAWYEPIARERSYDVGRKAAGLYGRCAKHFLWTLGKFPEHPAAALLVVEAFVVMRKEEEYLGQYLASVPPELRPAVAKTRLESATPEKRAMFEKWVAES